MTHRRDVRVDAVRGVALVSMYLAHCAPTLGPGRVLELADYATYPLFALLVGMGAELGRETQVQRWWVGPLVRGSVLLVLAELLDGLSAQVYVVLAFLGVLTWLAAPLARAGSVAVAAVGAGALAIAPWLNEQTSSRAPDLVSFLVVGGPGYSGPYQVASMVFFAAVGVLLARHLLPGPALDATRLTAGAGCAAVAAGWFVWGQSDVLTMRPYAVTHQVLVFEAVLVVGATLLAGVLTGRCGRVATPMAAMGAMSLTLYCLQILWLDADLRVLGHPSDDSWRNVAVLVLGSLAVALVWRAAVKVEPWRRGPLEGPVAALVSQLDRRSPRA